MISYSVFTGTSSFVGVSLAPLDKSIEQITEGRF
jgi:hypothetical protein